MAGPSVLRRALDPCRCVKCLPGELALQSDRQNPLLTSPEILVDAGRDSSFRLAKLQGEGGGAGAGKTRAAINQEMIKFADVILEQLPEDIVRAPSCAALLLLS